MQWKRWTAALLFLGCVGPASAADLARIDRVIQKEPVYQGQPKYCLAVFGPEARLRVWLVRDGDTLYVDRNGNGDLTEADEAVQKSRYFFAAGAIQEADGSTNYGSLAVYLVSSASNCRLCLSGKQAGGSLPFVQYAGYGQNRLTFADRPQDAPIVHFHGPMTIEVYQPPLILEPGRTNPFHILVGTPGLGEGTFVSINCKSLPSGIRPIGEFELPHQDPTLAPVRMTCDLGGN